MILCAQLLNNKALEINFEKKEKKTERNIKTIIPLIVVVVMRLLIRTGLFNFYNFVVLRMIVRISFIFENYKKN